MLRSSKRWWLWKEPVVGWHWWLWKELVVMCGNWNVRQAMSQHASATWSVSLIDTWYCIWGHAARVCVSNTNPQYGRVAEASCCNMRWFSAERGGRCSWRLVAKKDWKYVSVQKLVTLNTCCDFACLIFQLPHTTTGSFQSHQRLEECNILSVRWKSFAFYKVVLWHFSGVVGKE